VLNVLPDASFDALAGHFKIFEAPVGKRISSRTRAPRVCFPLGAVISLIRSLEDGEALEVSMIGSEGLAGITEVNVRHARASVVETLQGLLDVHSPAAFQPVPASGPELHADRHASRPRHHCAPRGSRVDCSCLFFRPCNPGTRASGVVLVTAVALSRSLLRCDTYRLRRTDEWGLAFSVSFVAIGRLLVALVPRR
jgi:hypothetical protein